MNPRGKPEHLTRPGSCLPWSFWAKLEETAFSGSQTWASPVALVVKKPPAKAGDIRDSRSIPGSGKGNPLQCSCLENPMGSGWRATVYGVTKSWTRLSDLGRKARPARGMTAQLASPRPRRQGHAFLRSRAAGGLRGPFIYKQRPLQTQTLDPEQGRGSETRAPVQRGEKGGSRGHPEVAGKGRVFRVAAQSREQSQEGAGRSPVIDIRGPASLL